MAKLGSHLATTTNQNIKSMTKEEKLNRAAVHVVVINGKSKFCAWNLWGSTTVIYITDDRPISTKKESRRAFFYRLRGYKKIKQTDEDRKRLIIKENLWGFEGIKFHTYVKQ